MLSEIIEVKQEARDVKTLKLKLPQALDFKPGQFIFVYGSVNKNGGTEEVKRAFSISSSPENKDYIEFTFNIVPGGKLSPVLYKMRPGENLKIEGPYGNFTFEPGETKNVVFVAGGTGIAPMMCMLRNSVSTRTEVELTMLYSVKTPEDIIYRDELYRLEKENKIKLGITISRPGGFEWEGHKGHIDLDFFRKYISDSKTPLYYVCGPSGFVQAMIKILKGEGVKPENIKLEAWG